MDFLVSYLNLGADKLSPYLGEISMAIVATILAIYGDFINKKIKNAIKDRPFLLRYASFIALCAFGYGFLTLFLAKFLSQSLRQVPPQYFIPSIVGCFVLLGILADRKNQI